MLMLMSSWACEVWKNEATIAARKAESAVREKEAAMLKLAQMQKEIDTLSGGPHLHAVRRVQDLKSAPMGVLKTLDWQLRKDLEAVEKVLENCMPHHFCELLLRFLLFLIDLSLA